MQRAIRLEKDRLRKREARRKAVETLSTTTKTTTSANAEDMRALHAEVSKYLSI
jgi:hypothetical protein